MTQETTRQIDRQIHGAHVGPIIGRIISILLVVLTGSFGMAGVAFNNWADQVDKASTAAMDFLTTSKQEIRGEIAIERTKIDEHNRQAAIHIAQYDARLAVLEQMAIDMRTELDRHFQREHLRRPQADNGGLGNAKTEGQDDGESAEQFAVAEMGRRGGRRRPGPAVAVADP